jgi:hypothetical protein
MKRHIKIIFIYSFIVITAIKILAETLRDTFFYSVKDYLILLTMFIVLLHIGMTISKRQVKKKYFIFISIIFGENLISNLLSVTLKKNSSYTLLDFISANVISITVAIMLFSIARTIKTTNEKASRILNLIGVLFAVLVSVVNVVVLIIGFQNLSL